MELFAPKKFGVSVEEVRTKLTEFVAIHKDILDFFEGIKQGLTLVLDQQDREKETDWLQEIEPQILTLYKLKFVVEKTRSNPSADMFIRERAEFAKHEMGLHAIGEIAGLFTAYHSKQSPTRNLVQEEPKLQERDIDAEVMRFLNRISLQTNLDMSVLKNYVQFERVAGLRPEFIEFFYVVEELVDLMNKLIIEEWVVIKEGQKVTDLAGKLLLDTHLLNSIAAIQFYYGKLVDFRSEQERLKEQQTEKEAIHRLVLELEQAEIIDFTKLIGTLLLEPSILPHSNSTLRQQGRERMASFCQLVMQLVDKKVLSPIYSNDSVKAFQFYILDKNSILLDLGTIKSERQLQNQYVILQSLEKEFDGEDAEEWKRDAAVAFAKVEVLIGQLAFHGLEYSAKFLEQKSGQILSSPSPMKVAELSEFSVYYELIISILCDELFLGNLIYEVEDRTHYLQMSSLDFIEKVTLIQDEELVNLEKLSLLCQRLKVFYQQVQRINIELADKSYKLAKQIATHIAQENDLAVSGFRFSVYNPMMDKVFGNLYQFLEKEVAQIENYFLGRDQQFYECLVNTLDMVKLYNSLVFKGLHDEFRTRDPEYPPQKKLFSGSQLVSFDAVSDTLLVLRSVLIAMDKEAKREEEMEDTYPIVERMITMNNLAFRKLPYLREHLLSNNQQFFQKTEQRHLLSPNTTEVQLKELCFEKGFSFIEFHNFLLNLERFMALHSELGAYLYTYRPLRNGTNSLASYYVFTPIIPEDNTFFSVLKKVFVGSSVSNSSLFSEKYERFKRQKLSSKEFRDISYLDNVNETLEEWKRVLIAHQLIEKKDTFEDDFTD
ncbi:MAG: hypothetical protein ACK4UP_01780 [Spirosomataceae bacterium]